MLTDFIRPIVAVLLWVVVAAFTLVELTTVAPSLGGRQGRRIDAKVARARHSTDARLSHASARW